MSVWSWLKLTVCLWLLRKMIKVAGWLLLAAVVLAAWPVTIVAGVGYAAAWLRGWPPARLRRTAAWALIPAGTWLAIQGARLHAWQPVALAPVHAWAHGWSRPAAGEPGPGVRAAGPVRGPGRAVRWPGWRGRGGPTRSPPGWAGSRPRPRSGSTPGSGDGRSAPREGLTEAPGAVPLLGRGGRIPVGGTIRDHRAPLAPRLHPPRHGVRPAHGHRRRHRQREDQLDDAAVGGLVHRHPGRSAGGEGATGRCWSCWTARAAATPASKPTAPAACCTAPAPAASRSGPMRPACPCGTSPPPDLAVLLYQMIDTGTGAAAYYADIMQAVLMLAVLAPGGPPLNTAAFLDRLDASWLQAAWDPARYPAEAKRVQGAARQLPDIQLRYATLLTRLGPALDGPGTLAEADAWYCILEGTREPSVAEAQAMALTELTARAATDLDAEPRAMLLAADDYSAVSGRVPLANLYERGRSLGIGVQVSAQSWQGLGASEDERYRIAGTADGGIFVLHVPYPEALVAAAGTRRVLETAHKLIGNAWGDEGTTREQRAWTADPDLVRRLETGQACYIQRGAATFVQVARPRPSPLTLLPPPAAPVRRRPGCPSRAANPPRPGCLAGPGRPG